MDGKNQPPPRQRNFTGQWRLAEEGREPLTQSPEFKNLRYILLYTKIGKSQ